MYSTKTYPAETPTSVWNEFTQLHNDRDKINSRLVELIAEDVQSQSDELEPAVKEEINRILGGDDGR